MWDPDWSPTGTSFGLNWSAWLEEDGSQTCLVSFMDRHYVGFRRISLETPWTKGQDPKLNVNASDWSGQCLNLSTDAFAEFENVVSCRCAVTLLWLTIPPRSGETVIERPAAATLRHPFT